ncbi:hypothetical protein DY000_02053296 [Brassica cretica]|uniref:Uncharacterized protein n=1 Tax=Brassica cretica TaxID=69181 RepID=A0ABQ7AIJ5_BRACR|nr:hypothetical protein DY000_02053296 [Brassica cretica]
MVASTMKIYRELSAIDFVVTNFNPNIVLSSMELGDETFVMLRLRITVFQFMKAIQFMDKCEAIKNFR